MSVEITMRLSELEYALLCRIAKQRGITENETVRQALLDSSFIDSTHLNGGRLIVEGSDGVRRNVKLTGRFVDGG